MLAPRICRTTEVSARHAASRPMASRSLGSCAGRSDDLPPARPADAHAVAVEGLRSRVRSIDGHERIDSPHPANSPAACLYRAPSPFMA